MDDFDARLERVLDAVRAHAAAVRSGGDVAAAIRAYDDAAEGYEEALADLGAEPPWYADADEEPPPALDDGDRVAVRARADFVVSDLPALLRVGTDARRRNWADSEAPPCVGVGEAVYELVHDAGRVFPMLDRPGLERRDAVLVVHRTSATAVSADDIAVADGEEQLYELME